MHPVLCGSFSLALATSIQFYIAFPLYWSSFRSLFRQHVTDTDLLVAGSASIAYIYSIISFSFLAAGNPIDGSFFETSAPLVTLIMSDAQFPHLRDVLQPQPSMLRMLCKSGWSPWLRTGLLDPYPQNSFSSMTFFKFPLTRPSPPMGSFGTGLLKWRNHSCLGKASQSRNREGPPLLPVP